MDAVAETVERAIVFEGASGYRREGALRCVEHLLSEYDFSLLQVDLGLNQAGPTLFVIFRFREDRFSDATHATLVATGEHAGGRVVALSELEYQERGHFLSRFAACEVQRLGLSPEAVPAELAALPAPAAERRASPRVPVKAEAVVVVGAQRLPGAVENLSAGGALVRTQPPPVVHTKVEVEVGLPDGPLRAPATVVKVSEQGVSLQFTPSAPAGLQERLAALPAPKLESKLQVADLVSAPTAAQEKLGPYELLSLLGTGGTAEVFYARAVEGPLAGQHVALKRLKARRAQDPAAVRTFEAEGKTLARLQDPHIVRALDAGVFDGQHCLVMELIEGHDLSQVLRRCRSRKKRLPVEVACYVAKVLLDALSVVHEAKDEQGEPLRLVHRDVSPHNLFVSKAGVLKLGDFGRARKAGLEGASAVKEGRPTYLSPEGLGGAVSPALDLWAAAVSLYELLTLEQPFAGETLDTLTQAIRGKRERPLRERRDECSGPLEAVLRKALEKDPARRYPSAREFGAAVLPHFHPVRAAQQLPSFIKELFAR